jgi:hypothetical protein
MERLKTNAFQFAAYAFPGKARKLMLLTNVAKIDIPTTQAGIFPPPVVNCMDVLFLKMKLTPKATFPMIRIKKTIASSKESFINHELKAF